MSFRDKVDKVFELAGIERVKNIDATKSASEVRKRLEAILSRKFGQEAGRELAFHLSDWSGEAAFLTALHLFPEQFSDEEIEKGIEAVVIHGTHHLMAACHLHGKSLQDVFNLNLKIE